MPVYTGLTSELGPALFLGRFLHLPHICCAAASWPGPSPAQASARLNWRAPSRGCIL